MPEPATADHFDSAKVLTAVAEKAASVQATGTGLISNGASTSISPTWRACSTHSTAHGLTSRTS